MSEKRRRTPYRYTRPQPAECPADISSDPCICGWHDLLEAARKVQASGFDLLGEALTRFQKAEQA